MRMPLKVARKFAQAICKEIEPYCYEGRVVVAGSIRRGRPICNDIDIVCMPKDLPALRKRATQKARPIAGGDGLFSVELPNGVQVDFFFVRPETHDLAGVQPTNWVTVLLCRTGSKEHNIHLVEAAKAAGLRWHPQRGVTSEDGQTLIASETEQDIFKALGMAYLAPERRER